MEKTQVMRILDKNKIEYNTYNYEGVISGIDVAEFLGINKDQMFKTLVTISNTNNIYVFLVSVNDELDLKKGAIIVNEKSLSMIPSKDLLKTTGYIHGGCSPIGMKKKFRTTIDKKAESFKTIFFSAGKIGFSVEVSLDNLSKVIDFTIADITK